MQNGLKGDKRRIFPSVPQCDQGRGCCNKPEEEMTMFKEIEAVGLNILLVFELARSSTITPRWLIKMIYSTRDINTEGILMSGRGLVTSLRIPCKSAVL